ncbi:DUF429 domain-containing protein [Neobacillus sp. Marseille-QA0830]
MRVMGIDLAGPRNQRDTFLTVFEKQDDNLHLIKILNDVSDLDILNEISCQSRLDELVIGIDAPLSYQDGGGDRLADKQLRQYIVSLGMKPGSIMPPTLNRMAYLTLRGIRLSREIGTIQTENPVSIVEVHPGSVIGSRLIQDEMEYVLNYKQDLSARKYLRNWFETQKLTGLPATIEEETHSIDACAAALGAWHWKDPAFAPKWISRAIPPLHPYDYCC